MNAYSYIRWSDPKQSEGDSFLRQTETARSICKEKDWNLVDLPPDKGVSAYKGKNLSHKGILGQFIKRVEQGLIPTPCVLIIEKLDRFSRRDADEIIPVFLQLLKSGVEVYSGLDRTHYTQAKIKDDPLTNLLKLVMEFVGANAYSKAIGERVRAARKRSLEKALSGKQIWMREQCPSYFSFKDGKYVANEKAKIVKRIFRVFQKEKALLPVTRALNIEKVPTFHGAEYWAAPTVKQILTSRHVMGELKGKKNYFPTIISEKEFNDVQLILHANSPGKGKRAYLFNFLKGIIHCKCGRGAVQSTNRVGKRYFGCNDYDRKACDQNHMVRAEMLELGLFAFVLESSPDELIKQTDALSAKEVKRIQDEIALIDRNIDKLMAVQDIGIEKLRTDLQAAKKRQETLKKELDIKTAKLNTPALVKTSRSELARLIAGSNDEELNDAMTVMVDKLNDDSFRRQLREPLSMIVDKVVVNFNAGSFHALLTTGAKSKEVYIGD